MKKKETTQNKGTKKKRKENGDYESFLEDIKALAKQISIIHKHAEAMGLFINDRELLECSCGWMEDVAFDGRLITYRRGQSTQDSGLRFIKVDEDTFRCPICRAHLKAEFL
jgi:hypothetical protein